MLEQAQQVLVWSGIYSYAVAGSSSNTYANGCPMTSCQQRTLLRISTTGTFMPSMERW
jgi:hypothetical protein